MLENNKTPVLELNQVSIVYETSMEMYKRLTR